MPHPLVQTLFLVAAGFALWKLWRIPAAHSPLVRLIVAGAVLARVVPGLALFWISWLQLPFASSLHTGEGFWFFGDDVKYEYFPNAVRGAEGGLTGIFTDIVPYTLSPVFTRLLALFVWLFGPVASIGLLLNIAVFLGMAALLVRWGARNDLPAGLIALPLIAMGFSPAWILWSLQPLKDPFFSFLIVLFAVAVDRWLEAWRARSARRIVTAVLLLLVTMYAIAGVRWYYALVALTAAAIPLLTIAFGRFGWRAVAGRLLAAGVLMILLARLIALGSGVYLPDQLRPILELSPRAVAAVREVPQVVNTAREAFDCYPSAGTRIGGGRIVQEIETPAVPARPSATTMGAGETVIVPATVSGRLVAGGAALLLPRFIAGRLGLVSIGGGRGFWWFAEADTLLFDAFVLLSLVLIVRALRSGAWRDPLVWYLLAITVLLTGLLAYTVSNFGTLFRHREMVLAGIALLPLAACRRLPRRVPASIETAGSGAPVVLGVPRNATP